MAETRVAPALPTVPAVEPGRCTNVGSLLSEAVERWPESIAARDDEGMLNYQQLLERADRVQAWLRASGVDIGDRVIATAFSRISTVVLFWATVRMGAVFVPYNPAAPVPVAVRLLLDAEPAVSIGLPREASAGRREGAHDWEELEGVIALEVPQQPQPLHHVEREDLCMLLYTSGSTAAPKGVMCPHGAVRAAVEAIQERLGYRPTDVVFNRLPLAFDYGLYQLLLTARSGACVTLAGAGSDAILVNKIRKAEATVLPLLPTLCTIIRHAGRRAAPVEGVRLITNTGADLPLRVRSDLRDFFPDARIALMYGITECKRVSIMEPDGDLRRPHSVGRPLSGLDVLVNDSEGRPVPPHVTGELTVRGPTVMAGYWRDHAETTRRFPPQESGEFPLLRTGDFGYVDNDGYIYFQGRRDDLFKHHGSRVSGLEVEHAAEQIPGVRLAALIIPTEDHEPLVLCVEGDVEPAAVLAGIAGRLERAKVPDVCVVVPQLPSTPNGKVDKVRLREMHALA